MRRKIEEHIGSFFFVLLAVLGAVTVTALVVSYGALSWGVVTLCFWKWFVLPVFPTLPGITFSEAMGLWMFLSLSRGYHKDNLKDEYKRDKIQWVGFLVPWITLTLGWFIYTCFMA